MPLRDAILAVLTLGDCHGSRLAAEIGRRTGTAVNPGQVAKTLARLVAEGLVAALPRDGQGRIPHALTPAGEAAAARWLDGTAVDAERLRLVASLPGIDRVALLAAQRDALERILAEAPPADGLADPPRRGRPARQG